MKEAFEAERAIKATVLERVIEAIRPCLPLIASKAFPPYERGILLLERPRPHGARQNLYLSDQGVLFVEAGGDVAALTPREAMDERWDLHELVMAISEEIDSNASGQLRKVEEVERIRRRVAAVAELLGGT